jgi:hypothetical protein
MFEDEASEYNFFTSLKGFRSLLSFVFHKASAKEKKYFLLFSRVNPIKL